MTKRLQALLALCLALSLTLCGPAAGLATSTLSMDYSTAEKMLRQIDAGSGFSGTLSLSLTPVAGREADAITTTSPLTLDVSYINVHADTSGAQAQQRYELLYPAGAETASASVTVSVIQDDIYLRSSLLGGTDWYTMQMPRPQSSLSEAGQGSSNADTPAASGTVAEGLAGLLSTSSMPALFSFFLPVLADMQGFSSPELEEIMTVYTTKIDLWIEGYRQSAELDKRADGTSTMQATYTIPPTAIKSQLKQLLLDLLADPDTIATLKNSLPSAQIAELLNPDLQSLYFFAIDELPLSGDMTISRTVSLKGDTLALHLKLPLYDRDAGDVTIAYDRETGEGDLPDENTVSLESENASLRLDYQEYRTMTGVTVYQGTFLREPQKTESEQKVLSTSFSLTHQQKTGVDSEDRETLSHAFTLALEPSLPAGANADAYYDFPALDIGLSAVFASKAAKNAATAMDVELTIGGEELPQVLTASFSGKTKAKWDVDAIQAANATQLSAMSADERTALLGRITVQGGLLFLPHFQLPALQGANDGNGTAQGTDGTSDTGEGTEAPSNTESPTTSIFPTATDIPAGEPEDTDAPGESGVPDATDAPASLPDGADVPEV